MGEEDDGYFDEPEYEDEEPEFECGAYINDKFDYYFCTLAGTEDCDWECPHGAVARIRAMKARQP